MHASKSSNRMKTFRLIPLVLAGICGYIHTVINRRFGEIGDLIHSGRNVLLDSSSSSGGAVVKPPKSALQSALDASITSSSGSGSSESSSQVVVAKGEVRRKRKLDLGMLLGPGVDELDTLAENTSFDWVQPKKGTTLAAISAEYDEVLLQYTLSMLPHHLEGAKGIHPSEEAEDPSTIKEEGNNNPAEGEGQATPDDEEEDLLHPKPYDYNQVDIIVPASGQDDRLQLFADRLGVALSNFDDWYETERRPAVLRTLKQEQDSELEAGAEPSLELKFRLLITRYPGDAQKSEEDFDAFHKDLAKRTTLHPEQVVLIRVGFDDIDPDHPLKFNRAHARNALHENACMEDTCIVTAMDVDMQVLPIFFHRALRSVKPYTKAYFPIVFSEFNPETVQRVQDFLYPANAQHDKNAEPRMLEPFSRHRGLWRDFGYGMYVMAGADAKRFRFNEEHQGWGHEDNDFYKLVHNAMRVDRQHEHGLIHGWHPKNCNVGKDIVTQAQWVDCLNSRDVMEGSILGLLLLPAKAPPNKDDFPGLAPQNENDNKDKVRLRDEFEEMELRAMALERGFDAPDHRILDRMSRVGPLGDEMRRRRNRPSKQSRPTTADNKKETDGEGSKGAADNGQNQEEDGNSNNNPENGENQEDEDGDSNSDLQNQPENDQNDLENEGGGADNANDADLQNVSDEGGGGEAEVGKDQGDAEETEKKEKMISGQGSLKDPSAKRTKKNFRPTLRDPDELKRLRQRIQ